MPKKRNRDNRGTMHDWSYPYAGKHPAPIFSVRGGGISQRKKFTHDILPGKSNIYVYRDFWSQILVYNIIQDIRKFPPHFSSFVLSGDKNPNLFWVRERRSEVNNVLS